MSRDLPGMMDPFFRVSTPRGYTDLQDIERGLIPVARYKGDGWQPSLHLAHPLRASAWSVIPPDSNSGSHYRVLTQAQEIPEWFEVSPFIQRERVELQEQDRLYRNFRSASFEDLQAFYFGPRSRADTLIEYGRRLGLKAVSPDERDHLQAVLFCRRFDHTSLEAIASGRVQDPTQFSGDELRRIADVFAAYREVRRLGDQAHALVVTSGLPLQQLKTSPWFGYESMVSGPIHEPFQPGVLFRNALSIDPVLTADTPLGRSISRYRRHPARFAEWLDTPLALGDGVGTYRLDPASSNRMKRIWMSLNPHHRGRLPEDRQLLTEMVEKQLVHSDALLDVLAQPEGEDPLSVLIPSNLTVRPRQIRAPRIGSVAPPPYDPARLTEDFLREGQQLSQLLQSALGLIDAVPEIQESISMEAAVPHVTSPDYSLAESFVL